MPDLPTGTVTFLFTDLERSTELWERFPEAMRVALARHDSLLRQAIERSGGHIVKARGDGFHAAFAKAPDALGAALAIQRALAESDWGEIGPLRVRIAIHTGAGEERDGDYFGPALNRAARLLDVTQGGEVLLSAATAQLVQDDLSPNVELRELGAWRFKGLARPEVVFQVVAPFLQADRSALPRLDGPPHNLPAPTTSFIGRKHALEETERLLERARLLTLVGAGGVGKTRLALTVAARQLNAYPDGAWLVDLAPLTDPGLVPQSVASALDVPQPPGQPVLAGLLNWLRTRHLLILLDNCEHLVNACAQLVDVIIRTCPNVRILATSREALGVTGEVRWSVPSMEVPDASQVTAVAALSECECVQLFVDRARLVSPNFTLDDEAVLTIAKICAQLDGIPLAIELAAARTHMLTPQQILERLDDRFRFLKSDSRVVSHRQQTLQALVDWSYDLLDVSERRLFDRLAVFAGSFTLEAAEAITIGNGIDSVDVLDLLTGLAEKSLVVVEGPSDERRYRLLVTLRQYAAARLASSGDATRVRRRHAEFFLKHAETAAPRLFSSEHRTWRDRLEAEHEELRTAVDWGCRHAPELALRLGTALWRFWWVGGYQGEGQAKLARVLGAAGEDVPMPVRLRARYALGNLAFRNGDYQSAQVSLSEVRGAAERSNDRLLLAEALGDLGRIAIDLLSFDEATRLLHASLALAEEAGRVNLIAWNHTNLGYLELAQLRADPARELVQRGLAGFEATDDQYGILSCRVYLGLTALISNQLELAHLQLVEALRLCREYQFIWPIPLVLESIAVVAIATGQPERGLRLAGAAAVLRSTYGIKPPIIWEQTYQQRVEPARTALGEALSAALVAEGHAMSIEQAVGYGLEDRPTGATIGVAISSSDPPRATPAFPG